MTRILQKIPFIGALLRKRAARRRKPDDDASMYPLY